MSDIKPEEEILDCPYCPNQGWFTGADQHTGEATQVQCEFCYCEPNSRFNREGTPNETN